MTNDSRPRPADPARQPGIPHLDGRIPFRGFATWYRIYGGPEEAGKLPLLCLHGGPDGSHDSISSLKALAVTGRRVIFYDQLGSGRSEIPEPHPDWWTVDLFVDEVRNVRRALGLDRVHLLGCSWGGSLAMAYMLTKPKGVASLIVSSGPPRVVGPTRTTSSPRCLPRRVSSHPRGSGTPDGSTPARHRRQRCEGGRRVVMVTLASDRVRVRSDLAHPVGRRAAA